MSNGMNFLPINVDGIAPVSGFAPYPEGFYMMEAVGPHEVKTNKDQKGQHVAYKHKIVMGPGWSQEYAGKPFTERISVAQDQAGRHVDLFAACFGSKETVWQMCKQYNGQPAPEMINGRRFIVQLSINGNFNNVLQRLPASDLNWQQNVGAAPGGGILTGNQQPMQAPQGGYAPPPAPPAPMMQQPNMQPMQAPQPLQGGYAMPPAPQGYAMPQPNQAAPAPTTYAAPPPPPGVPAIPLPQR